LLNENKFVISTHRLHLRDIVMSDLNDIHLLLSLPETDRYNVLGLPDAIDVTQKWVEEWISAQSMEPRISYTLYMAHRDTNTFAGLIALVKGKANYRIAEVWFKTLPTFWNQGYTTEALGELLRFGFTDLNLHRIEAGCAVENIASIKVLEKAGMIREGLKRKLLPIRGQWFDGYLYAQLEDDFFNQGHPPAV